ncbi:MAG: SRPBCC family protein [Ginsengibacter sp.]
MLQENIATVETQMLIRKPVSLVFQAFIDPSITTHFWFTKSSGKLETGKTVIWSWEMYGISTQIFVKEIEPNKKIVFEWGMPDKTTVSFDFNPLSDETTYLIIKNFGFKQTGFELIEKIKDSTGGFTTVLDGLKAYLEHGIQLNLIGDKFPKEVSNHGK